MKHWKKFLIIIFVAIAALNIPFVYKRYQRSQMSQTIAQMNSSRIERRNNEFTEFKGVIHVHSSVGGHSTGSFEEIVRAALENDLDFVVMTEHASAFFNTSAMTLNGVNEGVLYVPGHEFDTENQDRLLVIPGIENAEDMTRESTADTVSIVKEQRRAAIVAYPKDFKAWNSDFDGIEVLNLNTSAKKISPLSFLPDALWSFSAFPSLTLFDHLVRPGTELEIFDRVSIQRKISLHGGNDSHSNIGFHFFGDDAGNRLLEVKPDSYARSFEIFKTHVLLPIGTELSTESLTAALIRGNCFIGFDPLSETSGFSFMASNGEMTVIMGDELELIADKTSIRAAAPQKALFRLFFNGDVLRDFPDADSFELPALKAGVYRVEVYLPSLGNVPDKMPWIISNPIYIRPPKA